MSIDEGVTKYFQRNRLVLKYIAAVYPLLRQVPVYHVVASALVIVISFESRDSAKLYHVDHDVFSKCTVLYQDKILC